MNIKNLVLKNPLHRTKKENEFLILYLKHQYDIFYDIDKPAIEMFVQRLSFDVFKPGDVIAKVGTPCNKLIMFIDGEVNCMTRLPQRVHDSESSFSPYDGLVKVYKEGQSIGEECFDQDYFDFPFNMICKRRCMTLNLKRKDFAEVLLFQKQQMQVNW